MARSKPPNLHNKKVLIVGLAKTGMAAAQFLLKQGATVTAADVNSNKSTVLTNANKLQSMGVSVELGPHETQTFTNADLIVLSPGVPHTISPIVEAQNKNIPVIGETELASQFIDIPIIAITGTNGKTTTTELTGDMLRQSGKRVFVGGNIGMPLTELLLSDQTFDIAVVEISSFQLDTIKTFCPNVAILLNITEDHLYRYSDMTAYAHSKFKLFQNQGSNHIAILNGQDDYCLAGYSTIRSKIYWLDNAACEKQSIHCQSKILTTPLGSCFDISKTRLIGHHNRQNIAAAILASQFMGGTVDGIQETINTFKGLAHRVEYVSTINGISFYNDSKATNVDATLKALTCFNTPIRLILGGLDKGGDYARLIPEIQKTVCECILIGQAQQIIKKALKAHQKISHIPIHHSKTLDDAVKHAYSNACCGDIVLLSPACASFDMFDSYNHRGDTFKNSILQLIK